MIRFRKAEQPTHPGKLAARSFLLHFRINSGSLYNIESEYKGGRQYMRILIAEDEIATAKALKLLLEKAKYSVDIVHNGNDAWDCVSSGSYEVVVLDIMMPGMSGLEVLSRMRENHILTPVLLLTAKSEVEDRVAGLDAGADDYLAKPFATNELIARIRALGRRSENYSESLQTIGNLVLDGNRYEMRVKENRVSLTNKEYQLMELFVLHPGFVFSTEHLMEKIWGYDSESGMDVVWTHIGYVRKKLRSIGADGQLPGTEVPGLKGTCNSVHINLPEYSRLVYWAMPCKQRSYQWTGGYRSELPNYESNLFT